MGERIFVNGDSNTVYVGAIATGVQGEAHVFLQIPGIYEGARGNGYALYMVDATPGHKRTSMGAVDQDVNGGDLGG